MKLSEKCSNGEIRSPGTSQITVITPHGILEMHKGHQLRAMDFSADKIKEKAFIVGIRMPVRLRRRVKFGSQPLFIMKSYGEKGKQCNIVKVHMS